jgi:hypothetical protein
LSFVAAETTRLTGWVLSLILIRTFPLSQHHTVFWKLFSWKFLKLCVVVCVMTMEKILMNISDRIDVKPLSRI